MKYFRKAFLFILIISICVIYFGSILAAAEQEEHPAALHKYYTSICVSQEDTLWDLAGQYGNENYQSRQEYIRELKQINHLTDDTIYAGSYLTVFYYSPELK